MYRRGQDPGDENGQAGIQREAQDVRILNVDVPQQLRELRTLFQLVCAFAGMSLQF